MGHSLRNQFLENLLAGEWMSRVCKSRNVLDAKEREKATLEIASQHIGPRALVIHYDIHN